MRKNGTDVSSDDDDGNGNGGINGDGVNVNNPASENLTKNGKKLGPPFKHTGVSHHNKATMPPMLYSITITKSKCCWGAGITHMRPTYKMINDFDQYCRAQSAMCIIERAACDKCGRIFHAETPFLDGTSLGPVMLAVIMIMFSKATTDEHIAEQIDEIFGFELSENTIYNACMAIYTRLQMGMLAIIMRMIQIYPWIEMDEG